MDNGSATVATIAGLVRQREAGELSRDEFFDQLAAMQAAAGAWSRQQPEGAVSCAAPSAAQLVGPANSATGAGAGSGPLAAGAPRGAAEASVGDAAKNLLAQAMSEARARAAVAGSAVAGDAPEGAGGPGLAIGGLHAASAHPEPAARSDAGIGSGVAPQAMRAPGVAEPLPRSRRAAWSETLSVTGSVGDAPWSCASPCLPSSVEPSWDPGATRRSSSQGSERELEEAAAGGERLGHSVGSRSCDSAFSSFAQRSELWELRRSQRLEELQQRLHAKEAAACSFRPEVHGRNRDACAGGETAEALSPNGVAALVSRLSRTASGAALRSALSSSERKELEELRECTFRPHIGRASRSLVRSFAEGPGGSRPPRPPQAPEEAAFAPKTNPVPDGMENARAYLQEGVFARLSQVADCPSEAPSLRRSLSSSDGALYHFLERQNACEEARLRRLSDLQAATAPPHRPALSEASARLAERHAAASSARAAPARSAPAEPAPLDPECTFRPKITRAGRERQAKTPEQLGPRDAQRRSSRRDKALEERTRREMAELKAPKVKRYNGIGSRLRLTTDVEGVLDRIERSRQAKLKAAEKDLRERQKREDAECSFQPETKPAPAFVRQMAATRRVARELMEDKENDAVALERPEWR